MGREERGDTGNEALLGEPKSHAVGKTVGICAGDAEEKVNCPIFSLKDLRMGW